MQPGYESDRWRLMLYDRYDRPNPSISPRTSTATSNPFVWSPDSKTIYFQTEDKFEMPIYSIAASSGSSPQGRPRR